MNTVLTIDTGSVRFERRFESESEAKSFEKAMRSIYKGAQFLISSRPATWHNDKKVRRGYKKED